MGTPPSGGFSPRYEEEDFGWDGLAPAAKALAWLGVWLAAIVLVFLSAIVLKVLLWAMS